MTSNRFTIFLSILLLALWLRLINLNQSLWLDEAAQALESVRPFNQQWQIPYDFHPPLYHYFLHFWMVLGRAEWVMRLTSVLPGVATVGLVYLIGKESDKSNSAPQKHTSSSTKLRVSSQEEIGYLAALFLAIGPYHIYYSQELRMYSLATFWAALLIYSLISRRWWLHTIAAIGGVFTLYLFPLIFIAEGLFLYFHERKYLKPWLIGMAITGLIFSVWVPHLWEQMGSGLQLPQIWPQWRDLSSPGFLKTIPLTFAKFALGRITFENRFLYGGLVTLVAGVFCMPLVRSFQSLSFPRRRGSMVESSSKAWLLWYWLAVPVILAWIISIWIPLNGPWRLLFTLPALYLLVAYGVTQISSLKLRKFVIGGIVGLSLLGVILYHGNPQHHREDWETAVKTIHELSINNNGAVAFAFPEPFAPYEWYATDLNNAVGMIKDLRADSVEHLQVGRLEDESVIYYFEYLSGLSDPNKIIPGWFEDNGHKVSKTYDFRGVGFVYRYELY